MFLSFLVLFYGSFDGYARVYPCKLCNYFFDVIFYSSCKLLHLALFICTCILFLHMRTTHIHSFYVVKDTTNIMVLEPYEQKCLYPASSYVYHEGNLNIETGIMV